METRIIEQVKVYILWMNPMTGRAESRRIAAISCNKQKLIDFYHAEEAEQSYQDGEWDKAFKQGSVLEWFNPLYNEAYFDGLDHFGHGICEEWIEVGTIRNDLHMV